MKEILLKYKRGIRIFVIVVCLSAVVSAIAYVVYYEIATINSIKNSKQIRSDTESILRIYPKMENVKECLWEGKIVSEHSLFTVPGPSIYSRKGYIVLHEDKNIEFLENFVWEQVDDGWQPSFVDSKYSLDSAEWYTSYEFNKYMENGENTGNFYFDLKNRIIYFELITD